MSRIFWDTNLFIYLFEGRGRMAEQVAALRQRIRARNDQLYTSTLTLGEILVKPVEQRKEVLRRKYEEVIQGQTILIPFDLEAARAYAEIRADRTIRAPDAIQLACAARERIDLFVTNDDHLSGKTIPNIQFITSLEKAMDLL